MPNTQVDNRTNANDDGVRTLFRYVSYPALGDQSPNAIELRRRADALVKLGELYFARAEQLNDPFEASPQFFSPRTPEGSPDYESLKASLRQVYAPRWNWSEERIRRAEADLQTRIESGVFDADMALVAAKWGGRFRKDYPMCCFARERDSIPMWSYYASGHAGICVHFDAYRAPIGNAMRVNYSDTYPMLPMPMGEIRSSEVIEQGLLTKSAAWCHEREYRLINMPVYADPAGERLIGHILDGFFSWPNGPQLAIVPSRFVVGLTLGARMESALVEHFARICRDRQPSLPISLARIHPSRYELQFESLSG